MRSPARPTAGSDGSSSRTAARLFLDEVGDLGAEAQAKLLRAIEAKEIERVGGGKPIRVDVRIVSATNKDPAQAVIDGAFREDLLFRLNVIPIPIPPLRERPGDIPALVRHFSVLHRMRTGQAIQAWSEDAIAALTRHAWPGNVRELANIVERLAIVHAGRLVTESDVAAVLPVERAARSRNTPLPDPASLDHSLSDTLDEYERVLIARALSMASGNVAEAARRLKTDRPNLYRRMRRLGIPVGERVIASTSSTRVDMRRRLLTLLLAAVPGIGRAQQVRSAERQPLPPDVRREVVGRWNGANATALRSSERLAIEAGREVRGDVVVRNGPLILAGHVTGNVLALNSDVTLAPTARLDGDLLVVGGEVTGLNTARIGGGTRIYRQSLAYREEGDHIVATDEAGSNDAIWWRRLERHREGNWSDAVRVVQAGPYNRVEGLPIELGPAIHRLTPWGSIRFNAAAVVRTGSSFGSEGSDIGDNLRAEVRVGQERAIGVGGECIQRRRCDRRLAAVRSRDGARGLRHATRLSRLLPAPRRQRLRHALRRARSESDGVVRRRTLVVARAAKSVHAIQQRRSLAPKPDRRRRLVSPCRRVAEVRHAHRPRGSVVGMVPEHRSGVRPGHVRRRSSPWAFARDPASVTSPTRAASSTSAGTTASARRAQLNMRLVLGGWIDGDPLPLERRLSVDGPGTLPGYDFRSARAGPDVGACNVGATALARPAHCDRIALAQVEFRRDLRLDITSLWEDWPHHYRSAHGDVAWVVFADAGRGWIVDRQHDALTFGSGVIPPLSTFRTDVGTGFDFGGIGIYGAKAVSASTEPMNFFVRLRHRF